MSDPLDIIKYQDQRPFRIFASCLYVVGMLLFLIIALWKFAHWSP